MMSYCKEILHIEAEIEQVKEKMDLLEAQLQDLEAELEFLYELK